MSQVPWKSPGSLGRKLVMGKVSTGAGEGIEDHGHGPDV